MTDFDHTLDLIGLKCPLPALKTAKLLKTMRAGATLCVHCSDPMAVIDIPNLINETGDLLIAQRQEGTILVFEIEKRS